MIPTQYWLIVAFTLGGGSFAMVCAWRDFEFFMNSRKARRPSVHGGLDKE